MNIIFCRTISCALDMRDHPVLSLWQPHMIEVLFVSKIRFCWKLSGLAELLSFRHEFQNWARRQIITTGAGPQISSLESSLQKPDKIKKMDNTACKITVQHFRFNPLIHR